MLCSVISATIRPRGLALVKKALKNQEIEFEWIIAAPQKIEAKIQEVLGDFPYTFIGMPPLEEGMYWDLNTAYKLLFDKAQGDYVVSWQDYIWAKPDTLRRLCDASQRTQSVVSAVGDQYDQLDEYGRPTHLIWNDPRRTTKLGTFHECRFKDIEWNLCVAPRKTILDVGIDVELDRRGFGGDMYQVNERIAYNGGKFYIDQSIESFTLRHGRERDNWDKDHILFTGAYDKRKKELIALGKWGSLTN